MVTTSGPEWDAELTPAPRPEPRTAPPDHGAEDRATAEVLARLSAIEGLLAEQSAVLGELRTQVARLLAADPDGVPGTPAKRRVLRAPKS